MTDTTLLGSIDLPTRVAWSLVMPSEESQSVTSAVYLANSSWYCGSSAASRPAEMTSAMRHREEQEVDRQHDGDGHEPVGDVAPDESSAHGVHGDGQHQGEEGGADDARPSRGPRRGRGRASRRRSRPAPAGAAPVGVARPARRRRMPGRPSRPRLRFRRARRRPPAPRHPWRPGARRRWVRRSGRARCPFRPPLVCRHQPRSLAFWAANSSSVSTPASRSSPSCLSWLITSACDGAAGGGERTAAPAEERALGAA